MKIFQKYFCLFFMLMTVFAGLLIPFKVNAAPEPPVRVPIIDYPNYLAMDERDMVSGYAYEYLLEVAKYTGWKYEFRRMSFAEAMVALANGEVDLIPGNQYTEARAAKMDFSTKSMGDGGSVLCVRPDDDRYCYNDYAAYNGLKIATLAGTVRTAQAQKKLAQYGATADFREYASDEAAKTALDKKEVDAVLMSSIRCERRCKILARLDSIPLYFCTNKKRPQLITALNQAMEDLHLDKPYYEQQLNEKYYGSISIQLAFSQAEKDYIKQAKPIKIALAEDVAPIEYYDSQNKIFRGIVPDIIKLIAQKSGLQFQYVPRTTFENTRSQLASGEVTLLASVVNKPEMADFWKIDQTDPYCANSLSVVVRNNASDYHNKNSLVVVNKNFPYVGYVAQKSGYTNIIYADSFGDCVDMVHDNKAELTIISSSSTDVLLTRNGYDDLSAFLLPNSNMGFSIGLSKTADPILLTILNKAIAHISNEEKSVILMGNLNTLNNNVSLRHFLLIHRVPFLIFLIVCALIIIVLALMVASSRQKANKRLAETLEQARKSNHAKSDFLSRMSHDIRTPMNAIIGLTSLAKDEEMSSTARSYLSKIDSSSHFLLGLINDILDMSKIESGELVLKPEPYTSSEFKLAIDTVIQPLMNEKNINFSFITTNVYDCILVDRLRHDQIFFNLLSNAAKFTPASGKVAFIVEGIPPKGDLIGLRYIIKDNGIGMSEEFLKHLFEPFSQEATDDDDKTRGTGLGLPIVKSLVDAMKGTITVKSEPDKGTEITVELYLPLGQSSVKPTAKAFNYDSLKDARILLTEDHPLNAEISTRLLEKVGCRVTWAKNGQECVDKFKAAPLDYDIILMDMRMPVMGGLEATKTIRSLNMPEAKAIPIIALTANAYVEEMDESKAAGVNAHLSKPVDPKKLYATISEFLVGNK